MTLLIKCPTPRAILLLGGQDSRGIFCFPTDDGQSLPGLHVEVRATVPINELLIDRAIKAFGEIAQGSESLEGSETTLPRLAVTIVQEFADPIEIESGSAATLYLGIISPQYEIDRKSWRPLPDYLRAMKADRKRLPYMRAMQFLSGAMSASIKVVEAKEAYKHLTGRPNFDQ